MNDNCVKSVGRYRTIEVSVNTPNLSSMNVGIAKNASSPTTREGTSSNSSIPTMVDGTTPDPRMRLFMN